MSEKELLNAAASAAIKAGLSTGHANSWSDLTDELIDQAADAQRKTGDFREALEMAVQWWDGQSDRNDKLYWVAHAKELLG